MKIDNSTYNLIKDNMPKNYVLNNLAFFYSLFSDSTRIKILIALALSPMCVNDLVELLDLNQTTISHQLTLLKSFGVVRGTRENKYIIYSLTDKYVPSIMLKGFDYIINKNPA